MSEFLAEARVLIRPDTTRFAAELEAAVAAATTKPVVVPVVVTPTVTGTTGSEAIVAETTAATKAIERQNIVLQEQGAITQRATATERDLARAQEARAASQELLNTVSQAGVLTTTKLAAARAEFSQINRAVEQAEIAFSAAVKTGDAALADETAELLLNTRAKQANIRATVLEEIAAKREATAHEQAGRAIFAQGASLTGLRGAVLTSSGAFLGATIATIGFAKAIKEASDETEELNKSRVVFGASAEEIEKFAKTTATSLGISSTEALRATGIFGGMFRVLKISQPVAAQMSERLVTLASDLASFHNADPSDVLERLRAGLTGQARPLRTFSIFLTAARVQQEALIETGKKSIRDLTQRNLVQARYNIILKDGAIANGDFGNTSDRAANQSRILTARMHNLAAELGNTLLPTIVKTEQGLNDLFTVIGKLNGIKGPSGLDLLNKRLLGLPSVEDIKGPSLLDFLHDLAGNSKDAGQEVNLAANYLDAADRAARGAAFGIVLAARGMDTLAHSSAQAAAELLKIQSQGGGAQAQLPAARNKLKADQAFLQSVLAQSPSKEGRATAVKQAREAIVADRNLIDSLTGEITSAQEKATREAEAKARKAAAARKKAARELAQEQLDATTAFIDSFTPRSQILQNTLTRAGLFGTANQQIRINEQIVAADQAEIKAINARIAHLKLHGEALKAARAEIKRLEQEIFDTETAIQQLQAERDQAIREFQRSHLEAALSIAETTKPKTDDIRALNAIIAQDEKRIAQLKKKKNLTLEEKKELDDLRVDLAQRNQALKDLKGTQDKGNAAARAAFEFLQGTQGFASNLLGNLITGSTSGLVGGSQANPQGTLRVAADVQSAKSSSSPTSGQANATNDLLLKILHAIEKGNQRSESPEARYQRRVGAAIMDTAGNVHGIQ